MQSKITDLNTQLLPLLLSISLTEGAKEKEDILKAGDLDNNEVLKYYYKGFFSEEEKHRLVVKTGLM